LDEAKRESEPEWAVLISDAGDLLQVKSYFLSVEYESKK